MPRPDLYVIALTKVANWDLFLETLHLDSESPAFDRKLRRRIARAVEETMTVYSGPLPPGPDDLRRIGEAIRVFRKGTYEAKGRRRRIPLEVRKPR